MLPEKFAFHALVTRSLLYCQFTFQLLIALEPLLVIRIAPVKPLFHSLLTTYSQLAVWASALPEAAASPTPSMVTMPIRWVSERFFIVSSPGYKVKIDPAPGAGSKGALVQISHHSLSQLSQMLARCLRTYWPKRPNSRGKSIKIALTFFPDFLALYQFLKDSAVIFK